MSLSVARATAIENAELDAWRSMYRAVPQDFRAKFNPQLIEIGGVALTRCAAIPFVHFNAVLNLGMESNATEADLDAAVAAYRDASIARMTVFHHPLCQPAALPQWLSERGFVEKRGWDRVYRVGTPERIDPSPPRGEVSFVTRANASAWAQFLDRMYGLPTGPWLLELVGRPGWTHAMLQRDGQIVAVRSMFVGQRGAWFGVEAPIPGLMAPSFEDDHCILHALIGEAERRGASLFVADVEAANPAQEGPAYERWRALGFTVAYHRTHFVLG